MLACKICWMAKVNSATLAYSGQFMLLLLPTYLAQISTPDGRINSISVWEENIAMNEDLNK